MSDSVMQEIILEAPEEAAVYVRTPEGEEDRIFYDLNLLVIQMMPTVIAGVMEATTTGDAEKMNFYRGQFSVLQSINSSIDSLLAEKTLQGVENIADMGFDSEEK